jgi:hypothetical protein
VRRAKPLSKPRSTLGLLPPLEPSSPFSASPLPAATAMTAATAQIALRCVINDRSIIQVHDGIPKERPLLLCERVLLHPMTEIATRGTPMKVSELHTGGGGLAEITRRRTRRSPSSQLGAVSQIRRQMAHDSCLSNRNLPADDDTIQYEWRGGCPKTNTYSRYECDTTSLFQSDAWHYDMPKSTKYDCALELLLQ